MKSEHAAALELARTAQNRETMRAAFASIRPAPRRPAPPRRRARAVAMLAAVLCALGLAACGGGDYCEHPEPADVQACSADGRATVPARPASAAMI